MEFGILIGESLIKECGNQDCGASGCVREPSELTPSEKIELIKQLLTNDIKHEVWKLAIPTGYGHDVDQYYKE